jgi:septum formation protein
VTHPPALVLASRSPQRRAILEQLGLRFEVVEPDVEEGTAGDPRELVIANALRKAHAVAAGRPGEEHVLAADTEVVLDGRVYGKPGDRAEAERFLAELAGRTHEVISGIAVCHRGAERASAAVTLVRMRALEQADLDAYLDCGEWCERAGGYAIQGRGAALVEAVEGDFWNVVGLPVAELVRLLGSDFHALRAG